MPLKSSNKLTYRWNSLNLKPIFFYLVLSLAVFFINREFAIFLALAFIGGYVKFLRGKTKLPIIFEPVFFFTIIIAKSMGFNWAILYSLTANLIPEIMNLEFDIFSITWVIQLLLYSLIAIWLKQDIVIIGLIILIIDFLLSTLIHAFGGSPFSYITVAPISFFMFNLIYFIALGNIVYGMILW